jgi:hypothetical protein
MGRARHWAGQDRYRAKDLHFAWRSPTLARSTRTAQGPPQPETREVRLDLNDEPTYFWPVPNTFALSSLSVEAKGFFVILKMLATHKTGILPFKYSRPEVLESFVYGSKRLRLRLEKELREAGLLVVEPERRWQKTRDGVRRLVSARNIYKVSKIVGQRSEVQNCNAELSAERFSTAAVTLCQRR